MDATLYLVDGDPHLHVGERDPDNIECEVLASREVEADPADVYEFLTESSTGEFPTPTIEAVTNRYDPWLAWYGGSLDERHAVLYGPRGADDRKVSFADRDGSFEVRLAFGTVEDVPNHEFAPNEREPITIETNSETYATRTFHDLCDVT